MWHCHITGLHWFRCCMTDAVFPSKGKIGAGRTWLHEFRWCCPCDEEDLFSVSSDGRRSEGIWWLAQCIHYMNESDCMRMISGDLEVDDAHVFLGRTFWRGSYRGFATRNDEYVRKLTVLFSFQWKLAFLCITLILQRHHMMCKDRFSLAFFRHLRHRPKKLNTG